ncbi:MAG: hypothetical protein IT270_13980 [Saprospiraceae bacterium]|nr:hypothetical protein [Saprospiraceae bacterium]
MPTIQKVWFISILAVLCSTRVVAQDPTAPPTPPAPPTVVAVNTEMPAPDSVMVTVVMKHQQNKNLPEIRRVLEAQGFWDIFPPHDARIVSWTIAMGLGHVVVLKMPPSAVRRLNLAIENGAWGAFDTEIYLTYDYMPIFGEYIDRREEAKEDRR